MNLTPQNFTSLRTLVARMSEGLFTPEKQRSRVGLAAKPKDFSASKNQLPTGTTLQFSAGRCMGKQTNKVVARKIETYTMDPEPNAVYQAVPDDDSRRIKNAANFTGFDYKKCWELCTTYFPGTIAVNGPEIAPPDDEACTFPFYYPVKNKTTELFKFLFEERLKEAQRENGYVEGDCIPKDRWMDLSASVPDWAYFAQADNCTYEDDVHKYIETYEQEPTPFYSCVTNPEDSSTGNTAGETLYCPTPSFVASGGTQGKIKTCNQECYCQVCGGECSQGTQPILQHDP